MTWNWVKEAFRSTKEGNKVVTTLGLILIIATFFPISAVTFFVLYKVTVQMNATGCLIITSNVLWCIRIAFNIYYIGLLFSKCSKEDAKFFRICGKVLAWVLTLIWTVVFKDSLPVTILGDYWFIVPIVTIIWMMHSEGIIAVFKPREVVVG